MAIEGTEGKFALKRLADKNLDAAITLAKHYRDLNQPEEAESICRDVLEVSPGSADAWRTLGLALTDQFPTSWMTLFDDACKAFEKLPSAYEKVYYVGVAWERYAKAQLAAGRSHNAVHAFEEAMARFEEAAKLSAKDDPAPILHYNHCVRSITSNAELTRASETPHEPEYEFGD
jgi:tetratricopeptide (TPR) repeat protein